MPKGRAAGSKRESVLPSGVAREHPVLDSLLEGCQVIGRDWRYLYVNEALLKYSRLTREQLIGRTMMEAYPGIEKTPLFALLERCMEDGTPAQLENEFVFPDGSQGWFELRLGAVPDGVLIMSLDITERRRAEEQLRSVEDQLRQSQKLEAIGQLAGGVAHDFNNILTVQLGFCDLLLDDLDPDSQIAKDVRQIRDCSSRAARLTQQLLAFSRKQAVEARILDLNAVVRGMDTMLQRLIGEDVRLVTTLAGDLGKVRADPGQMEQVILNLVVNARDAMPSGGTLTMETANVELDQEYVRRHIGAKTGPYVMLAITDTGQGMDEKTRSRLFEPFFTTKEAGKGTGLGLATLYGIVKQANGNIWVYSEPGRGTTFKIYLPRHVGASDPGPTQEAAESSGAGELILVVEDDASLRELFARMIGNLGYRVVVAENGAAALDAVINQGVSPDLLFTDVIMPEMGGRALVDELRRLRPTLRVLFTSGYTGNAIVHHGVLQPGTPFLQKPFSVRELGARIREVLGTAQ